MAGHREKYYILLQWPHRRGLHTCYITIHRIQRTVARKKKTFKKQINFKVAKKCFLFYLSISGTPAPI